MFSEQVTTKIRRDCQEEKGDISRVKLSGESGRTETGRLDEQERRSGKQLRVSGHKAQGYSSSRKDEWAVVQCPPGSGPVLGVSDPGSVPGAMFG